MNNKGQSILSEYVMIFFVVIAAVVAMTTFIQRGLEARVNDAKNFVLDSVVNSGACDANCLRATGGNISYEYEPYYTVALSDVSQNDADTETARQGNAQVLGAIYTKISNEETATISTSCQAPPQCAGYDLTSSSAPCYCTCSCTPLRTGPIGPIPSSGGVARGG